jgi:predicted nucleotidyltransferase
VLEKTSFRAIFDAMRRDDVIAHLKQTEPALRALGVARLYLFGSHARDEAGAKSDVDVLLIQHRTTISVPAVYGGL